MQELIDKLNYSIQNSKGDFQMHFAWVKSHCIMLLEKEKQQIIKAHKEGFDHIVVDFKKQEFAEQYYNQTYNENQ